MKKLVSLILLGILLTSTIMFLPNVHAVSHSAYYNAVNNGANRLLDLQSGAGDAANDAGWDWDVTGLLTHSDNPSATNLYGVTGLGLLAAGLQGSDGSGYYPLNYWGGAFNVANFMTQDLTLDPTSGDFYNGFSYGGNTYQFGHSFDYSFLAQYAGTAWNYVVPTYSGSYELGDDGLDEMAFALDAWKWQVANIPRYNHGNQTLLFDHFANEWVGLGYYDLGAWQAADYGMAAYNLYMYPAYWFGSKYIKAYLGLSYWNEALDALTWATEMANTINASVPLILASAATNQTTDNVNMGLAWSLNLLNTIGDPSYASNIALLQSALEANQLSDGSWWDPSTYNSPPGVPSTGEVQTTAYAVMALWGLEPSLSASEYLNLQKGADWLVNQQQAFYGWYGSPTEYSEVDSEAIQAIYMASPGTTATFHDVEFMLMTLNATLPLPGGPSGYVEKVADTLEINVTAKNEGHAAEDVTVTVYVYGPSTPYPTPQVLPSQEDSNLAISATHKFTFEWNTAGKTPGLYIVYATVAYSGGSHSAGLLVQLVSTLPTIPAVSIVPTPKTWLVGGTFTEDVDIANVDAYWDMAGFAINITYNPSIVNVASVTEGSFLSSVGVTASDIEIDNNNGWVFVYVYIIQDKTGTVATSGTLYSITFSGVGLGGCDLTLQSVQLSAWPDATKWGVTSSVYIPYTGTNAHVTMVTPMKGDINCDGHVDLGDLVLLAQAYNSKPGDPNWKSAADIDGSGQVDLADLVSLAINYNKSYP